METKINIEYENLIKKLNIALEEIGKRLASNSIVITNIEEVKYALEKLGTRPIINNNVQQFMAITNNMVTTYAAKNHDYGNSFDKSLDKFGLTASVVRMGDKMNRIESLMNKDIAVKDESIRDTLLDLANYCVMTSMWLENKNK